MHVPLYPARDINHPFVRLLHAVYVPYLSLTRQPISVIRLSQYQTADVQVTLILFNESLKAIHMTSVTERCFNCSVLLLVVVNLLLCLICKVNVITGLHV